MRSSSYSFGFINTSFPADLTLRTAPTPNEQTHWDMIVENILEAPCVSVTLACDHREVLVSTKNGKIWRCLTKDLTTTLHSASHTVFMESDEGVSPSVFSFCRYECL